MQLITAPEPLPEITQPSVFLAGSIAGDTAKQWQNQVITALAKTSITIFNPRRAAWDASWEQSITNPKFTEQVTWELDALEQSNLIIMYFDSTTQSPITLLELGLHAQSEKLIVCCPEGFWRKGNVDVVCKRYGIPQVADLEALIAAVKHKLCRTTT